MFGTLIPWRTRVPAVRWFERDMEDLMDRFFRNGEFGPMSVIEFAPKADVAETETAYEVTMDLPGTDPKEMTVEIRDGALWVSGERKEEKEEKGKSFHRVERHFGAFRRVVPLELPVDREKVTAQYGDGVLKVTIAKSAAESKRIEVKGV